MWNLELDDLESIAIGAGILGTGGGGNPYQGKLRARRLLREGKQVPVMALDDLADDALVVTVGGMGAPVIEMEKIERGTETYEAVQTIEQHLGRRFDAIIPVEIGGANSIEPMVCAAHAGVPVIDADGMGRAFPQTPMVTYFIYGVSCYPYAAADAHGNRVLFTEGPDVDSLERLARACTVQMGGLAGGATAVMSGADAKRTAIRGTLTLARDLGASVRAAREAHDDAISAVLDRTGGQLLFTGKLVDVDRRVTDGFAKGRVRIEGLDAFAGRSMDVDFQNENLVAWLDGEPVTTVPDLICILDMEDGEPITTELLRYGYRVAVLGIPCSPMLRTPEALAVVGPQAFGYDEVPFVPLEGGVL